MFAEWMTAAGLGTLKPVIATLLLPPVPFIALALLGVGLVRRRPPLARGLVVLACVALWLSTCDGMARLAERWLREPPALDAAQRAALKARAAAGEPIAILVLGGGMTDWAPEYGRPDPSSNSIARLRYGAWLARRTGLPLAASGGRGWAAQDPAIPAEAERMAEIARDELGVPLHWTETRSRDTHENAVDAVAMLRAAGIREIVLVTQGMHMPRALREFRDAAGSGGAALAVTPAPMDQAGMAESPLLEWTPSGYGARRLRDALHEALALLVDGR